MQLFQAILGLVGTHTAQARLDRAEEATRQLERLIPLMPLPPFVYVGSLLEARQILEHALSLADPPLPPISMNVHAVALGYLSLVLLHQGHAEQARARIIEEAARRSAALERPFDRGLVAHMACFVHPALRDMAALVDAADQAAASTISHRSRQWADSAAGAC